MTKAVQKIDATNIHDASKQEVLAWALKEGLEYPENSTRDFLISDICLQKGWHFPEPEKTATHVEIVIAKTSVPGGTRPYRGSANGERAFTITRGKRVIITVLQYNTIVEANGAAFRHPSLDEQGRLKNKDLPGNESILENKIHTYPYPIQVIQWIDNSGKQKEQKNNK